MTKKRTSHEKRQKPRGAASGIPVFCLHDEIVDAASLRLWSEQPGQKNPQVHPAKQLDRYETVVSGNGFRRCAVVSTLSGCVTKGNGLVMMCRRRGWHVPIEHQAYANRAEEIRDVAADNRIAEMAEHDDEALKKMLGELDASEIQFAAVNDAEFQALVAKITAETEADAGSALRALTLQPPPQNAWALIGIPVERYGEIAPHIEAIAALIGTYCETTASDKLIPQPKEKPQPAKPHGKKDR